MRRFLILTLSVCLIFASLTGASAKSPKAGKACKKVGKVVISKNREFTCLKKKGKRVWSKGVIVKITPSISPTPSPSPSPSPIASSTPTVTPSPTPTTVYSPKPTPSPSVTTIPTPSPSSTPNSSSTPTPTPTVRGYTRADVAQRNTPSDCWTIVDGNVYDLTSWIGAHPGGPGVIRGLCGVDGTVTFEAQHGRSARPNSILESYLLGPLKS